MRGIKIPQQYFALKIQGGLMREGGRICGTLRYICCKVLCLYMYVTLNRAHTQCNSLLTLASFLWKWYALDIANMNVISWWQLYVSFHEPVSEQSCVHKTSSYVSSKNRDYRRSRKFHCETNFAVVTNCKILTRENKLTRQRSMNKLTHSSPHPSGINVRLTTTASNPWLS